MKGMTKPKSTAMKKGPMGKVPTTSTESRGKRKLAGGPRKKKRG